MRVYGTSNNYNGRRKSETILLLLQFPVRTSHHRTCIVLRAREYYVILSLFIIITAAMINNSDDNTIHVSYSPIYVYNIPACTKVAINRVYARTFKAKLWLKSKGLLAFHRRGGGGGGGLQRLSLYTATLHYWRHFRAPWIIYLPFYGLSVDDGAGR